MREDESAMERLCRELMDHVVFVSGPDDWCEEHGMDAEHTTYAEDTERARADIERRIEEARAEDEENAPTAASVKREYSEKAAELDSLREAGRVLPEGVEWPRWEDGRPLRIGDAVGGEKVDHVRLYAKRWTLADRCGSFLASGAHGDGSRVKRPEPPDSWERLEADAEKDHESYWGCIGFVCAGCPASADGKTPRERYGSRSCTEAIRRDLVRRARALAGAE